MSLIVPSGRLLRPEPELWGGGGAAGGIQFVGAVTGGAQGNQTVTLDLTSLAGGIGSAAIEDDYVIVLVIGCTYADESVAITTPSGYTSIGAEQFVNDNRDTNSELFAKFMGATPDTSVTGTVYGSSAESNVAIAYVLRGVDTTTPLDVAVVIKTETNTVLFDPDAITPVTTGAWIVVAGGGGHVRGTQTYSHGTLKGVTSVGYNDTLDCSAVMAYWDEWVSGAYDPGQFSFSGSDSSQYSNAGYTLAIRPA